MALSMESRITLNDGAKIPVLGLGVWQAGAGKETRKAVSAALESGYRLIDTAKLYGNERDVGAALRERGMPRDEIFVTTKLWNSDQAFDSALRAFEGSRRELGLEYVDLYLVHWPVPQLRNESWKALLKIREQGLARSIGVSNYTIPHLEELLSATPVPPSVNQVEFYPFLFQRELLEYGQKHHIQLEAYSPLTRGRRLKDPVIKEIAAKYGRTPAQILIRWGLQHGLVVIPKDVRPAPIRQNGDVVRLEVKPPPKARLDALAERPH